LETSAEVIPLGGFPISRNARDRESPKWQEGFFCKETAEESLPPPNPRGDSGPEEPAGSYSRSETGVAQTFLQGKKRVKRSNEFTGSLKEKKLSKTDLTKQYSPWPNLLNGGNETGQKPNRQDIVSITYEEIGFFPRSFSRVLDRFLKQVFSDVENLVIQEYRFYRYLFLTTLKCVLILFFVPFMVNYFSKTYLVSPLTEYFWNTQQTEIFLNS
jgi:hypothetical protein